MGFEQTTFGEYAKVQGGNAYKSKDFIEKSSNKVLKIKNVRFGTVNYADSGYISDELAQATEAWQAKEGDILISMTGSGPNAPQSLVGRVARVWKDEPAAWINQRVGRIQLKNKGSIHPDFLFYLLSLPQSQEFLVSNSSGSANQANISGKIIELLPCPKVSFNQSKYVADIARSLDEKIILNKQTNQTLEQMAQTLFKSWFVDFDPVFDNLLAKVDFDLRKLPSDFPDALQKRAQKRLLVLNSEVGAVTKLNAKANSEVNAKASLKTSLENDSTENIHQHFPSEFEHYEKLGWVPKGWQESNVGSEFDVTMGQSPPGSTYNEIYEGIPFFQGKTDYGFRFPSNRIYCTAPKRLANKNDTLVSVRAPVGTINLAAEKCAIGRGLAAVRHKSGSISFTYYAMNDLAKHFAVFEGEGTVFGSINQKDFNALPQLSIPAELANLFNQFCSSWDEKIELTSLQINELTKLRDTLLPKLISGELQILETDS